MTIISGYFTQRDSFVNTGNNAQTSAHAGTFSGNEHGVSRQEHETILSQFLSDFSGYEYRQGSDSDHDYFQRTVGEQTDCVRIVQDGDTYKILHTTYDGNNAPTSEVYEITAADRLNYWNSDASYNVLAEGGEVEDFEMFEFNGPTYSKDVLAFAQQYIDKYDTEDANGVKDGKLSLDEFIAMCQDNVEIPEDQKEQLMALYTVLFEGFQMDDDNNTVSAEEFASQLMVGDVVGDGNFDGKINFVDYNTVAADPYSETYEDDLEYRRELYNHFYA